MTESTDPIAALRAEFEAFREASAKREDMALREAETLRERLARTTPTDPSPTIVKAPTGPRTFYRSALRDTAYFAANKAEILRAAALGRIIPDPDEPDWRVRGYTTQASRDTARKGTR